MLRCLKLDANDGGRSKGRKFPASCPSYTRSVVTSLIKGSGEGIVQWRSSLVPLLIEMTKERGLMREVVGV